MGEGSWVGPQTWILAVWSILILVKNQGSLLGWPQPSEVALVPQLSLPRSLLVSIFWKTADPIASATLRAEGSLYCQELVFLVCSMDWNPLIVWGS